MQTDVGGVIAGKYKLVRLIGRGSMGEVWAAHHQTLGELVALKLLSQTEEGTEGAESQATAAARFQFEAQVAARLSRKTRHIVRVTDHGEEDGLAYLVMELLDGETLDAVLERDGRLPLATAATVVAQVARALTQAHGEHVLHRDLKPANVFLSHDEDGHLLVKLLDFGIARAIHAHRAPSAFSTAKGLVFGTPSYMSPEQARASHTLDHRCDLWALATIAYEAVTGNLPLDGQDTDELLRNLCAGRIVPVHQRDPALPEGLAAFFDRALHESPSARYETASDMSQAFARALGAMPERDVSSPSLPRFALDEPPPSLPRRSRARAVAIATGALLVTFVAVGAAWRALAGASPSVSAVPPPQPTVSASAPSVAIAPLPSPGTTEPGVAVSALPRAATMRPAGPAPASHVPLAPPAGELAPLPPALLPKPGAPGADPAPATPALPPPPAPPPTASAKKDRSEVF
jgi:serine/threonine protein kinase